MHLAQLVFHRVVSRVTIATTSRRGLITLLTSPKGSCAQIVKMYFRLNVVPMIRYFQVYTICVHGPLRL